MDARTKTTRRNFDQITAAGKNAMQDAQVHYGAAMENARGLNTKLVEMFCANANNALEASGQIASAKNLADFAQVWSTYAIKQFAILNQQARELTAVWQKFFVPPR